MSYAECRNAECHYAECRGATGVVLSLAPCMLRQGTLTECTSVQLTSLYQLFGSAHFHSQSITFLFYKTNYLNEEGNCTDPSHSVSVPGLGKINRNNPLPSTRSEDKI